MADVAKLEVQVSQTGAQQTGAALDGVARSGKAAETSFGGLALKIAGYTSAVNIAVDVTKRIIGGIKDLAVQSVTLAGGFEKAKITWGVLVGDMDKGSQVFEKLRQFAAETPLSFEGIESAAQILKGFGVETEQLIPTLSRLGDLARGDNSALGRIALVFGQVQAQGKAMTQDLYQFINSGVPIFNLLADSMGVATGEIKELAAQGKIGFKEIEAAIRKATDQGGRFYDLMALTSQSATGKASTALDLYREKLADIGEKLLPIVNKGLDQFISAMNRMSGKEALTAVLEKSIRDRGTILNAVKYLQQEISSVEAVMAKASGYGADALFSSAYAKIDAARLQLLKDQMVELQDILRRLPRAIATPGPTVTPPDQIQRSNDALMEAVRLQSEWTEAAQNAENFIASSDVYAELFAKMDRYNRTLEESIRKQSEWTEIAQNAENLIIKMPPEIDETAEAMKRLNQAIASSAIYEAADALKMMGGFAADGALSFREMGTAIASMGLQILNILPQLAIQTGLTLLTNINPADDAMGWWLLLGGGLGSMLAGYANEASKNAQGNAFGASGLMAFASGGAFTNKIVNKPTLFAFAGGAGLMGEAGPEAIMPLKRTSSGALGVESSGSRAVQVVEIHNHTGQPVTKSQSEGANGEQILKVVIGTVARGMADGMFDGVMGSRYGVRNAGVRR